MVHLNRLKRNNTLSKVLKNITYYRYKLKHKIEKETNLTPAGRRATKYFSGVFVVGIHHEPFGKRQFAFIGV